MKDFGDIPQWDGDPHKWEAYKGKVKIYCMAQDRSKQTSLVAKLIMGLSGIAAKVMGSGFDDEHYLPLPKADQLLREGTEKPGPTKDDPAVKTPRSIRADEWHHANQIGVERYIQKLEEKLYIGKPKDKALRFSEFFEHDKYSRRRGQRMADWVIHWDEGVQRLSEVGGCSGDK